MNTKNKKWDIEEIGDRLEEAARTLRRLPDVKPRGFYNTWPAVIKSTTELLQEEKLPTRRGPPSAEEISRMEEALEWLLLLDDELERKIVWSRATKVRWKTLCWTLGCGRTKATSLWRVALMKICFSLNTEISGQKHPRKFTADMSAKTV